MNTTINEDSETDTHWTYTIHMLTNTIDMDISSIYCILYKP